MQQYMLLKRLVRKAENLRPPVAQRLLQSSASHSSQIRLPTFGALLQISKSDLPLSS